MVRTTLRHLDEVLVHLANLGRELARELAHLRPESSPGRAHANAHHGARAKGAWGLDAGARVGTDARGIGEEGTDWSCKLTIID